MSASTNETHVEDDDYCEKRIGLADLGRLLAADLDHRLKRMARESSVKNRLFCALSPNLLAVGLYRLSRYFQCIGWRLPSRFFYGANVVLFGCDITPYTEIGPGLNIDHVVGTVVHAKLGRDVCLHGQVVLGGNGNGVVDKGWRGGPIVGDRAVFGFGARVLGHVRIGDNVRIGATALVVRSLPDDVIAMGNPARIVDVNDDRSDG